MTTLWDYITLADKWNVCFPYQPADNDIKLEIAHKKDDWVYKFFDHENSKLLIAFDNVSVPLNGNQPSDDSVFNASHKTIMMRYHRICNDMTLRCCLGDEEGSQKIKRDRK